MLAGEGLGKRQVLSKRSDGEGRGAVGPGIVLGHGHPVLGPAVCLAPGLIISCLLSPPDGVGDKEETCLAQVGASSVKPIPAEGLLNTQSWRSCGGAAEDRAPACRLLPSSFLVPQQAGQSLPFSLSSLCTRQDPESYSDLLHDLAVSCCAGISALTPPTSPAPEILSIPQGTC